MESGEEKSAAVGGPGKVLLEIAIVGKTKRSHWQCFVLKKLIGLNYTSRRGADLLSLASA
jgi:hypothetical protein